MPEYEELLTPEVRTSCERTMANAAIGVVSGWTIKNKGTLITTAEFRERMREQVTHYVQIANLQIEEIGKVNG